MKKSVCTNCFYQIRPNLLKHVSGWVVFLGQNVCDIIEISLHCMHCIRFRAYFVSHPFIIFDVIKFNCFSLTVLVVLYLESTKNSIRVRASSLNVDAYIYISNQQYLHWIVDLKWRQWHFNIKFYFRRLTMSMNVLESSKFNNKFCKVSLKKSHWVVLWVSSLRS